MEIRAPLSGVIVPLESVPDPVFARRMVGDGVAIDPTSNEVLAPVAGRVTQLHDAHHAIAITADDGVEILIHVGLDTVSLGGKGFTPLVALGAQVACGQPVLHVDMDRVACSARSLLTAVIVTSPERVAALEPAQGFVEAGVSTLLELEVCEPPSLPSSSGGAADAPLSELEAGEPILSEPVELPNAAGLHARPAAVLANEAKKYGGRVWLVRGTEEVNAKSVVAIMGLSTKQGDRVQIKATGREAAMAAAELSQLLAHGCGELASDAPVAAAAASSPVVLVFPPLPVESRGASALSEGELAGAPASPGLALGRVFQHRPVAISVQDVGGPRHEERAKLRTAVREAARQIEALKQHASGRARAQILDVHLALLDDPDLVAATERLLGEGKSAAYAWQQAFTAQAAKLEKLDSRVLRERAADIRDVGRRLLALLAGVKETCVALPEGSILIAEELTPSEMASFDRSHLLGLCTTTGGSTSHVAILARSMGIPAICGVDEAALALHDGTRVAIDGTHGMLRVSPDDGYAAQVQERIARQASRAEADAAAAFALGQTRDGHRVEVVANICNAKDAADAIAAGAEGVGLLRSEFLFDDRDSAPTEDEQAAEYAAVAAVLGKNRPLVVRTLDVGGDKPLPYLPLPRERNPFLGLRGIRVSLNAPEMFRTQLRAILRAAPQGNVHVMFPMIATLDEVRSAKQILAEEQVAFPHAVKVGVMIEVPSAAVMAEVLAREVDFFSIGTNDLTQYTFAMDRGHPKLANLADALHPAVLRMIAMTVEGAHEHGKWVGVCGGLASDALATPLLVGLGIDELSVSLPDIASIKATLSRWTLDECSALATKVLRMRSAAEVRAYLAAQTEEAAANDGGAAERVLR